jgi:flagellar hook assembly protein FlgD
VSVTPPRPAALALSPPAPNPASGAQRLSLSLPAAGSVQAVVMDVAGRTVRTLHRGFAPGGALSLEWDGRDDRGRAVEAGLYWVRARAVGGEAAAKVVRVR